MAHAEITEIVSVEPARFFATVVDYARYPEFVDGCKRTVVTAGEAGQTRVTYDVSMMKEISYTLDHRADEKAGTMEWSLIESAFLKKNNGQWRISAAGAGQAKVTYAIEIEFKFPVPSLILNRLVKASLPAMLRNFAEQAKKAK